MSQMGQSRHFKRATLTSGLPPQTDINRPARLVRFVPIVLKKFFLGDERNFLGPVMRFVRGDVRDHIASHKNDHGPSYRRYRALQRSRRLKISFRKIFGIVRFSTFATVSANSGLILAPVAKASAVGPVSVPFLVHRQSGCGPDRHKASLAPLCLARRVI